MRLEDGSIGLRADEAWRAIDFIGQILSRLYVQSAYAIGKMKSIP